MKRLSLHRDVLKEVDEAAQFYERRVPLLGARFAKAVRAGLHAIAEHPDRHPIFYEDTRRYLIKDFPYRIVYRATGDGIRVLAVAHTHRHPAYWAKRK